MRSLFMCPLLEDGSNPFSDPLPPSDRYAVWKSERCSWPNKTQHGPNIKSDLAPFFPNTGILWFLELEDSHFTFQLWCSWAWLPTGTASRATPGSKPVSKEENCQESDKWSRREPRKQASQEWHSTGCAISSTTLGFLITSRLILVVATYT
jgi:hypothetical protein